ncbi:1-acyl-sn-glycerol-3-phosphate acyltransferase [Jannaschia seohaensis]|uniref:Glycerol-3-phosphate acyltransferase n=1 Tax=Jannaschia seohaensis TaxID=475081 RepID=A0A2Y9A1R2_9RHOB|nr:1-acyl-sn-glycerol-3-phosphate acyltransferase [Jannaschia seohaensis]PWJ22102.1 glycerol-3-phosphate O-acyltransferase [Jannaschia seohaensis]SSA38380.1 glycerol-3-phosphate O-acyltransferase [Jannaschia seohaensis]
MTQTVPVPLWALLLLCAFAAVTFASHFLFPSVRWFFRRRAERLIAQLNTRLTRPIEPFKLAHRTDTVNRLIHDPEVAQAILDHASEEGVPESVAFETARRYANEIVPGFSAVLYFSVAMRLARWLSRGLYRVRVTGEDAALKGVDPDATVVFVLNHRSNMDYVLVTWLTSSQTALAYAVGEWARRWPLAPLIRALGGYFVRRRDLNGLYRKVLARYVQIATRNGVTQAVFPEGRLSRDGALHPPKLGILSYILDGHDAQARDVVFVPVAVNYERVLEDRVLIAARTTGPKAFRLRWWMVARYLARHVQLRLLGRFTRFGYAAVSFGRPVSLNAFLTGRHADPAAALGELLMGRIASALPVLPAPLVAEAVLAGARDVASVATHLSARSAALAAQGFPVHAANDSPEETAQAALRMLHIRKVLRLDGTSIQPDPDWLPVLQFYARTLPEPVPRLGMPPVAETQNYAKS